MFTSPAERDYGAIRMDYVPAHSPLILELELVKIER